MARRGREDTQAPAQPGPCASVAERLALPGHPTASTRKGLNEGPLTSWCFQALAEAEASSPIPAYLQEKEKGHTTSEKAQKHFKH